MTQRLGRWLRTIAVVGVSLGAVLAGTMARAQAPGKRPVIVTTVAPLTNIAKNVGGPLVDVRGLIPEGTDSHTFEPAPSDVQLIAGADLVILNGLDLETPTEKLALANKKAGTRIVKLGDATITPKQYVFDRSFPQSEGHPN